MRGHGTTQVKVLSLKQAFTTLALPTMWGNMGPSRPAKVIVTTASFKTVFDNGDFQKQG
jgi:hypothetical protein